LLIRQSLNTNFDLSVITIGTANRQILGKWLPLSWVARIGGGVMLSLWDRQRLPDLEKQLEKKNILSLCMTCFGIRYYSCSAEKMAYSTGMKGVFIEEPKMIKSVLVTGKRMGDGRFSTNYTISF